MRRKLAQADPDHAKDLAASLNLWWHTLMCLNRAFDWNAIWRHGKARHDLSTAIELYRQLAATDPEKHHASLSATEKLMREWLERA